MNRKASGVSGPGREHGVCVLNIAAAASSIGEALLSISRTVNSPYSLL
jgi:hypothetical protein